MKNVKDMMAVFKVTCGRLVLHARANDASVRHDI